MSKEIEKKSKSKFVLKLMAISAISVAVWKIVIAVLGGNDNRWEN